MKAAIFVITFDTFSVPGTVIIVNTTNMSHDDTFRTGSKLCSGALSGLLLTYFQAIHHDGKADILFVK